MLAGLETQIEGAAGWAANLPTWKPVSSKWYSRLYGKFMGGRELTLYHLLVFSLVFIFMHYPYFAGKVWNFSSEFTALSFLFLVVIIWDFLWFVVNPKYDFRSFWGEHVLWHKKWFLHLPVDYWFALMISALLYAKFSLALLKEWLWIIGLFFTLTIIVIILAAAVGILKPKEEFKK